MDCSQFRACLIEADINTQEDEIQAEAMEHMRTCPACADAALAASLQAHGALSGEYPCVHMAQFAGIQAATHAGATGFPGAPVHYDAVFDEYSIAHNGDDTRQVINFCPWCGTILPESRRNAWFAQLRAMGFENPSEQDIPAAFTSAAWRQQVQERATDDTASPNAIQGGVKTGERFSLLLK